MKFLQFLKTNPNLYFQAIFTAIFFTLINKLLDDFLIPIDQIMIYLIGVIIVASRYGKAASWNREIFRSKKNYILLIKLSALHWCGLKPDYSITNIADNLEMIAIDGSLIEQVIVNILDNAAKYTKEQGIITIFVYQENDNMVVVISDSGSGIEVGEEKKIFDKFYTNHHNGIAKKGTGLGLAICQTIINLHHGKIWAKSKIDGDAQFTFTLPVKNENWNFNY
jgi:K+-sensing histidine kinase KdpD